MNNTIDPRGPDMTTTVYDFDGREFTVPDHEHVYPAGRCEFIVGYGVKSANREFGAIRCGEGRL